MDPFLVLNERDNAVVRLKRKEKWVERWNADLQCVELVHKRAGYVEVRARNAEAAWTKMAIARGGLGKFL